MKTAELIHIGSSKMHFAKDLVLFHVERVLLE